MKDYVKFFITVLSFLFLLTSCSTKIYEPIGLALPVKVENEGVLAAIEFGIGKTKWEVESQNYNDFILIRKFEKKQARVSVSFDRSLEIVNFNYIDSENMDYVNKTISFVYNMELLDLEKQIALTLAELIYEQ